jgi:Tol biopolymer transport system component
VRLSPTGEKLAFVLGSPNSDLWVDELVRGVQMRLTNDPGTDKGLPVWSPDGSRIVFSALRGKARLGIYTKPSNGAGDEELLLPAEASDLQVWPTSWSRDDKFILYSRGDLLGATQAEIWVLPLAGDPKPRLFVKTPVAAYDGQFSPDSRWVAYTSKESGREEVYVVLFDATKVLHTVPSSVTSPGGKLQISPSGGSSPRWRRDGKEIFYLAPDNQMMAVEVEAKGNSFEARKAQALFRVAGAASASPYDVTPDGKRFVINAVSNTNAPLILVVNWTARLGNKP